MTGEAVVEQAMQDVAADRPVSGRMAVRAAVCVMFLRRRVADLTVARLVMGELYPAPVAGAVAVNAVRGVMFGWSRVTVAAAVGHMNFLIIRPGPSGVAGAALRRAVVLGALVAGQAVCIVGMVNLGPLPIGRGMAHAAGIQFVVRWLVISMALITTGGIGTVLYRYIQPVLHILVAVGTAPRIIFFMVRGFVAGFTILATRTRARIGLLHTGEQHPMAGFARIVMVKGECLPAFGVHMAV